MVYTHAQHGLLQNRTWCSKDNCLLFYQTGDQYQSEWSDRRVIPVTQTMHNYHSAASLRSNPVHSDFVIHRKQSTGQISDLKILMTSGYALGRNITTSTQYICLRELNFLCGVYLKKTSQTSQACGQRYKISQMPLCHVNRTQKTNAQCSLIWLNTCDMLTVNRATCIKHQTCPQRSKCRTPLPINILWREFSQNTLMQFLFKLYGQGVDVHISQNTFSLWFPFSYPI